MEVPGHPTPAELVFVDCAGVHHAEILGVLEKHFADAVTAPIRDNVRLSEAPSYQQTVFEYAPRSHGAIDYRKLVERFCDG